MWYEALPSLLITGVFVGLPFAAAPFIHRFFQNGNPYSRLQADCFEWHIIRRDRRLGNGDEYKTRLLEAIPDK